MSTTIDTILKLSGAKDIDSFYKMFPDEDSFMKVHGAAFKKAMRGAKVKKAQVGMTMPTMDYIAPIPTQQLASQLDTKTLAGVSNGFDFGAMAGPAMNIAEGLVKGFEQLKNERKKLQEATQWKKVSDVTLQASQLTPERIEREYVRPDDIINAGDEFFPVYGVGKGVLAKKGAKIPKAQFGDILQGIGSERLTNFATQLSGGESAGATFGGVAGDIVSMIPGVGPIVGTLAKPILSAVGNLIDTNPEKTKKYQDRFEGNINQMAMGKGMQGLFNTNNAYMASGGNVSNMETEGELRIGKGGAKSLSYNPFLPDGGETIEFTGPSHAEGGMPVAYGRNPVEVEGGEPAVKLQSGGTDEDLVVFGDLTIPGTKQTFKKKVKDIAKEEAKQNKKAEKALLSVEDLSPTNSFDKLKLNSAKATLMGTTQKLKAYASEKQQLASLQEAINQTAEEMNVDANALSKGKYKIAKKGAIIPKAQSGIKKPQYRSGLAKLLGIEAEPGYNERERSIGNWFMRHSFPPVTWEDVPTIQNEVNTKSPVPTIAPGSFPNIPIIGTQSPYLSPDTGYVNPNVLTPKNPQLYHEPIVPHNWDDEIAMKYNQGNVTSNTSTKEKPSTKKAKKLSKLDEAVADAVAMQSTLRGPNDVAPPRMKTPYERYKYNDDETEITALGRGVQQTNDKVLDVLADLYDKSGKKSEKRDGKLTKEEIADLMTLGINSLLPYFRPSDTERLDPRQLMGEMFALTDKEEPVQAQFFQPQLGSPYSVSFADQKNDIIAQVRSAQRMAGNNPAAQAMIASQAAQALNKINAEEFRLNQAMRDKVYGENRAMLNDAQLKNLAILDQQYQRQAQAKSNTKALWREALMSISDKYMKNQLNNRTLAAYENLYNYRFDPRFRAQNWNAPYYAWDYSGIGFDEDEYSDRRDMVARYESDPITGERRVVGWRKKTKEEREKESKGITARNGAIIKAMRNL